MQRHRPACDGCGVRAEPGCGWRVRLRPDGKSYCPECRKADPVEPKAEHHCVDCGTKPLDQFYISRGYASGPCRSCTLAKHRLRLYGVTQSEIDQMFNDQAGCCAICDQPMGTPHLDHCHAPGHPRGLLCRECNTGLGMFDDDVDRLRRAAEYLLQQVDVLGGLHV